MRLRSKDVAEVAIEVAIGVADGFGLWFGKRLRLGNLPSISTKASSCVMTMSWKLACVAFRFWRVLGLRLRLGGIRPSVALISRYRFVSTSGAMKAMRLVMVSGLLAMNSRAAR